MFVVKGGGGGVRAGFGENDLGLVGMGSSVRTERGAHENAGKSIIKVIIDRTTPLGNERSQPRIGEGIEFSLRFEGREKKDDEWVAFK